MKCIHKIFDDWRVKLGSTYFWDSNFKLSTFLNNLKLTAKWVVQKLSQPFLFAQKSVWCWFILNLKWLYYIKLTFDSVTDVQWSNYLKYCFDTWDILRINIFYYWLWFKKHLKIEFIEHMTTIQINLNLSLNYFEDWQNYFISKMNYLKIQHEYLLCLKTKQQRYSLIKSLKFYN